MGKLCSAGSILVYILLHVHCSTVLHLPACCSLKHFSFASMVAWIFTFCCLFGCFDSLCVCESSSFNSSTVKLVCECPLGCFVFHSDDLSSEDLPCMLPDTDSRYPGVLTSFCFLLTVLSAGKTEGYEKAKTSFIESWVVQPYIFSFMHMAPFKLRTEKKSPEARLDMPSPSLFPSPFCFSLSLPASTHFVVKETLPCSLNIKE